MIHALLLAFLASPAFAYTPSPVRSSTDTRTINNNLLDIANEIERRSLITGGTINGSLTISSGIVSNGTNTWTGANTFTSSVTFSGPVLGTINLSSKTIISLSNVIHLLAVEAPAA